MNKGFLLRIVQVGLFVFQLRSQQFQHELMIGVGTTPRHCG